jgi:hypothetical protein
MAKNMWRTGNWSIKNDLTNVFWTINLWDFDQANCGFNNQQLHLIINVGYIWPENHFPKAISEISAYKMRMVSSSWVWDWMYARLIGRNDPRHVRRFWGYSALQAFSLDGSHIALWPDFSGWRGARRSQTKALWPLGSSAYWPTPRGSPRERILYCQVSAMEGHTIFDRFYLL